MNIVFDIGGTNMRVAGARAGALGEIKKRPTPHEARDMVAQLVTMAKEEAGGEMIESIVGCIPGILAEGVFVYQPPHLSQWVGTPFIQLLEKELNTKAIATNDMGLIGLGEAHLGAGKGSSIMMYVTVSTGVNAARITDGVIDKTTYGFEMGHQMIPDGELESLISGTAVRKKFGVEPKDLESIDERNILADYLALGLYNSVLHWSPDTIVIGGSMITGVNPIPLDRVRESLQKRLTMYPKAPDIKMAVLGDSAGLQGALILAAKVR